MAILGFVLFSECWQFRTRDKKCHAIHYPTLKLSSAVYEQGRYLWLNVKGNGTYLVRGYGWGPTDFIAAELKGK